MDSSKQGIPYINKGKVQKTSGNNSHRQSSNFKTSQSNFHQQRKFANKAINRDVANL